MAQRRALGFRLDRLAYRVWESDTWDLRLEEAVDRMLALPDAAVDLRSMGPYGPWRLSATILGRRAILVGSRDASGAWTVVHLIQTLPAG